MVVVGTGATGLTAQRRLPRVIPVTLAYFTLMEGLQAAGYLVVDQCGSPMNQAITLASYAHIVLQPFFINALAMTFVPEGVARRVRTWVYALCVLASALMLLQLYPADLMGSCRIGQPLCGNQLCLRSGKWHIAWDIPYNGLSWVLDGRLGTNFGFPSYMLAAFVLPLLYGSWRFALFHVLVGPVLANALTSDPNEAPAVWCLFSIAIILVAISPRLLAHAHAEAWFLWPKEWLDAGSESRLADGGSSPRR
jgi:hypothetical protein